MARLEVTGPDLRMPGLKGQYQVYRWRGQLVIRAWPRPRPGPMSQAQQDAIDKFKEAALAAKYLAYQEQDVAREMTKGTQLLPRDMIYSALYGRMVTVFATSGRIFYSMASWQDVSDVLNIISNEPWVTLYRGPDNKWHPIPPGELEQVFTSNGPDAAPSWEDPTIPTGSGIMSGFSMDSNGTLDALGSNGKGYMFRPDSDFLVHEVWLRGNLVAGESFRPIVGEVTSPVANGTFVTVHTGPAVADIVTQNGCWRRLPMGTPAVLTAGTPYFVGQYRTAGATGTSLPLLGSTTGTNSITIPARAGAIGRFNNLNPVAGTAYTHVGGAGSVGIGMIWGNP